MIYIARLTGIAVEGEGSLVADTAGVEAHNWEDSQYVAGFDQGKTT